MSERKDSWFTIFSIHLVVMAMVAFVFYWMMKGVYEIYRLIKRNKYSRGFFLILFSLLFILSFVYAYFWNQKYDAAQARIYLSNEGYGEEYIEEYISDPTFMKYFRDSIEDRNDNN